MPEIDMRCFVNLDDARGNRLEHAKHDAVRVVHRASHAGECEPEHVQFGTERLAGRCDFDGIANDDRTFGKRVTNLIQRQVRSGDVADGDEADALGPPTGERLHDDAIADLYVQVSPLAAVEADHVQSVVLLAASICVEQNRAVSRDEANVCAFLEAEGFEDRTAETGARLADILEPGRSNVHAHRSLLRHFKASRHLRRRVDVPEKGKICAGGDRHQTFLHPSYAFSSSLPGRKPTWV
ncbi:MAG: hypothetical protein M3303_06710 [Gemmatimonadota bacterium]|nr:hypothetical protein [Gemmatimonadota bacterium]